MSNSTDHNILEIVHFKKIDSFSDQELIDAGIAVNKILAGFDGYIDRYQAKSGDNDWVDVITWESQERAEQSSKNVMSIETCLHYFSMMDEKSITMTYNQITITHSK